MENCFQSQATSSGRHFWIGSNARSLPPITERSKIAEASGGVVSPEQTLIVFALVARHGYAPQNDLGVPLDAADREALQDWAGANLTKALPASFVVLHHIMVRIGEHLARTGETLRELVGDPPKPGKMDAGLSE